MSEKRSLFTLLVNFAIIIVLMPIGLQVFGDGASILLGSAVVLAHPWLPLVFGYIPMLLLMFVYLRALLEPWKTFGFQKPQSHIWFSVGIGVLSAVVLLGIDLATNYFQTHPTPLTSIGVGIGFMIAWGLLGPFTEELLFRGTIQTMLENHIKSSWKIHPAIYIAAGFEVLMHFMAALFRAPIDNVIPTILSTLPQLAYVGVFGAISGWVFYKTRSLIGPLLIHGIGNAGELLLYWVFFV